MPPTMNRSAALASAAQALNKPKAPQQVQGRDVTTRNGQQGIVGRGGNFQALGAAAQRRLGTPPPTPTLNGPNMAGGGTTNPAVRTPPIMDPNQRPAPGTPFPHGDEMPGTAGPEAAMQLSDIMGMRQMGGRPPAGPGGPPSPFNPGDALTVAGFGGPMGGPGQSPLGVALGGGGMTLPGQPGLPTKPMLRGFGGPPHGVAETPGIVPDMPGNPAGGGGGGESGPQGSIWGRIAGRGKNQFANAEL